MVRGPLAVPERTILKGEGTGLVTLWWGTGHFNLDGGGPQGRMKIDEPKPPHTLIEGPDFEISDMSLYLPIDYEQGIVPTGRFRMERVKIRIDHYWLVQGRGNGVVVRMAKNGQITDCDILAKGDAIVPGQFALIARNKILSNKSNTPMGGSREIIVEENQFVSMDPTAYQNISGSGRNIYYAHNQQEAFYGHQSDYSFTFDSGTGAYVGKISTNGTHVTLATDPTYPKWASEKSDLWRRSCLCILNGPGAGQWRDVLSNNGRNWEIDRPFDVTPDETSMASIIGFNGRVLIVGNRFEDGNWVNAGYGTSIDVICADNQVVRCANMMNYGLRSEQACQPSWHVQYFDNHVSEGQTGISSSGDGHKSALYAGPLTCCAVHRRHVIEADNGGSISIGGTLRDVIVEGCILKNPLGVIKADDKSEGVLFRKNTFAGTNTPRYEGSGAQTRMGGRRRGPEITLKSSPKNMATRFMPRNWRRSIEC